VSRLRGVTIERLPTSDGANCRAPDRAGGDESRRFNPVALAFIGKADTGMTTGDQIVGSTQLQKFDPIGLMDADRPKSVIPATTLWGR
jgi:hypothetical protein